MSVYLVKVGEVDLRGHVEVKAQESEHFGLQAVEFLKTNSPDLRVIEIGVVVIIVELYREQQGSEDNSVGAAKAEGEVGVALEQPVDVYERQGVARVRAHRVLL